MTAAAAFFLARMASQQPAPEPPALFQPGSICTGEYESHPSFSPDGATLYFLKSTPDFGFWTIVVSTLRNGQWTRPEVAPFSGRYSDADPFLSPDGRLLLFISARPHAGNADGNLDLWAVDRTDQGWGEPRPLDPPLNSPGNEWHPSLDRAGNLYFGSDRPGGRGRTDLYRARFADGRWQEPENLGEAVNTELEEFEPLIAPDGSFLVFMGRRRDGIGGFDLLLSRWQDGAWTPARVLPEPINSPANELSPRLSPDGATFYFASTRGFSAQPLERALSYTELSQRLNSPGNGLGDIYQVSAAALFR